ncbi:dTDP-4-dehydrorhamnose reductase [Ferruginivarius sediminum]|uniref:dTDP-4-dehydrorhamnose reductase n=1 Tax=Ferruginivarius sediminum TaxID=2661937 RepID=A0A369TAA2_9PROT|nr:dTDP-4-dehydrorhamnose reductase [Ferruginivarius sediminum]RDD62261.1 dTDP-4-dehydrorhamnose reductase [Ferruginivarius sediminum]
MSGPGRVLVFGGDGQLGRGLRKAAADSRAELMALGHGEVDIADAGSVADAIANAAPGTVINAAAYTKVDDAEDETEAAYRVNRDGAANIARACARQGCALIHVSTDYVFDGTSERPWRPDDPPSPLNAYGATKLAGEEAVRAAGAQAAIVRTAWVFSPWGQNFVRSMLRLGRERERLTIVDDQTGSPTSAIDLARALLAAAPHVRDGVTGTFHFGGQPPVSWYGFARVIFDLAAPGWPRVPEVQPIPSSEFPTRARRPHYSVLDTSAFEAAFGYPAPDWRASLREVLGELGELETERGAT